MKKFLLLVFCLFVSLSAFGQSFMHFGLNGNFGASFLLNMKTYYPSSLDPEPKLSFYGGGGLTVGINFVQFLGIQTGLNYQIQGQKLDYKLSYDPLTRKTITAELSNTYSYLKLPFLLRINSSPNHEAMFVLLLGAQAGWLMGASNDIKTDTAFARQYPDGLTSFNKKDFFRSPMLDGVVELGADFWAGPVIIGFHIRGEYAFNDLFKKQETIDPLRNFTAGLNLSVSYYIPFSEKVEFKHTRRWH